MCLIHASDWRETASYKGWAEPIVYPSDPFGEAVKKADRRITEIAQDVASGRMDADEFEEAMSEVLRTLHIESHYAGQEISDWIPPQRALARDRGGAVAISEVQYLRGFALALAQLDSRYWEDGEWNERAIMARARSYLARSRGTAADGWTSATPGSEFVLWTLGGAEEHCEDCPFWEAKGPMLVDGDTNFGQDVLPFRPGEGETECLIGCKCHLTRVSDGAISPTAFEFATASAA